MKELHLSNTRNRHHLLRDLPEPLQDLPDLLRDLPELLRGLPEVLHDLPEADVTVHSKDFCMVGTEQEALDSLIGFVTFILKPTSSIISTLGTASSNNTASYSQMVQL